MSTSDMEGEFTVVGYAKKSGRLCAISAHHTFEAALRHIDHLKRHCTSHELFQVKGLPWSEASGFVAAANGGRV